MYKPGEAFANLADYDSGIRKIAPYYDLMQDIISRMIPRDAAHVLELGSGTGELTLKLLNDKPGIHILCVDYSSRMLDYIKIKIERAGKSQRVDYIAHDFSALARLDHPYLKKDSLDACVSMLAVHHLDTEDKLKLIRSVYSVLKPGGHFWIADILLPGCSEIDGYYSTARQDWKEKQNFTPEMAALQMINREEHPEDDHDKPDTIQTQLEMFEIAGFRSADILWKYFGMGIFGGIR